MVETPEGDKAFRVERLRIYKERPKYLVPSPKKEVVIEKEEAEHIDVSVNKTEAKVKFLDGSDTGWYPIIAKEMRPCPTKRHICRAEPCLTIEEEMFFPGDAVVTATGKKGTILRTEGNLFFVQVHGSTRPAILKERELQLRDTMNVKKTVKNARKRHRRKIATLKRKLDALVPAEEKQ